MTATRSGWRKVRFDQMASVVTERVEPADATVDRYVGLEHLDPETLTIERWGHPSEVIGTKYRVRPGQIIFGKRRFYQRKVAVAPFDCICSAHAMVLEERNDTVAKGFLPHFMLSETFVERALAISEGSLSPTIKWKRLAEQEFMLPPLDRQREIVELLEAVESARCGTARMAGQIDLVVGARRAALMREGAAVDSLSGQKGLAWGRVTSRWPTCPLGTLCEVVRGSSPRPKGNPLYYSDQRTEHHWLKISDVALHGRDGVVRDTEEFLTDQGALKSRPMSPGDLLLTNSATIGIPVISGISGCFHDGFLSFQRLDPALSVEFLFEVLLHVRPYLQAIAPTGTQANLNTGILKELEVPVPHLLEQRLVVAQIASLRELGTKAHAHSDTLARLRGTLAAPLLAPAEGA